jgi:hypothetical protein
MGESEAKLQPMLDKRGSKINMAGAHRKAKEALAKMKLSINADGTCALGFNLDNHGKWTANGNEVTTVFGGDKTQFIYDPKAKTLLASHDGQSSLFQKDE